MHAHLLLQAPMELVISLESHTTLSARQYNTRYISDANRTRGLCSRPVTSISVWRSNDLHFAGWFTKVTLGGKQ